MMFIVRNIFRNNKQFTNCISTSTILKDKKSAKNDEKNEQTNSSDKKFAENTKEKPSSSIQMKKSTDDLLIDALLNVKKKFPKSKKTGMKQKVVESDPLNKAAGSLAKDVAKELGGDKEKITEELMNYLKSLDVLDDSREKRQSKVVSYAEEGNNLQKSERKRFFFKEKMTLGIFRRDIMKATNQVNLKIWNDLEAEELAFQSKCHPRNYFEELISWTNEGKLWHFPIDNDQGLDKEAEISFTEHIFMEQYLEPWCPQKGPLRKFMELVLIGLSKNPYLTVEEKKSHISWFRNYFENKKKLLQELGAMGPPKEIEVPKQEQ